MKLLRIHGTSALTTVVVWAGVAATMGWQAFAVLVVLTLLEVTFSFDNAVVNAKLVRLLSPFWEKLFLTVGILIAVVVVRFTLPVVIVAATAGLPMATVIDLVLHDPAAYGQHLTHAAPLIDAFGGTFLIMIAVGFFVDDAKDRHWIAVIERRLATLGRYGRIDVVAMLVAALVMYFTVPDTQQRAGVLAAAVCGILLHLILGVFSTITEAGPRTRTVKLTGAAAAVVFARLEVLDASFSFDGVIGAFVLTSSVVLIAAGLGIGSLWVRSLTVHMVHVGTLDKIVYLEHGAHWAILALGTVMIAKLYGWHPPELVTGSIGLLFAAAAVLSSRTERRRLAQQQT